MIVVSNTTPIISLLKLNKLNLLKEMFGEVIIPVAVFNEITVKNAFAEEVAKFNASNFIKVIPIKNEFAVNILQKQLGLDLGESEAITLAEDIKSNLLLIDERKGRRVAEESGLSIAGTLGIIAKSKKLGLIDEVKPLLDLLIANSIRISTDLYTEILSISNEK